MSEQRAHSISIDHDPNTRKGSFADFMMVRTKGGVSRLDFIQRDIELDGGDEQAVLVSRVFMSNEDILALRDMLVQHTASWKVDDDGTEA